MPLGSAELVEYCDALFQPAPDRTVDEGAAGLSVAGIIEPNAGASVLGGPCVQRQRFGSLHVRIETAQPKKSGRTAFAGAHGDAARGAALADLDEGRFRIRFSGIGHGIVTPVRCCLSEHARSVNGGQYRL